MYVVMAGLPASGKSTIAKVLQQQLAAVSFDAVLLDKDSVRAFLFGEYTEYSREQDDLCMETIYSTAGFLVRRHPKLIVILDGRTYSRAYQVKAVRTAGVNAGTTIRLLECTCSESSAKGRLKNANKQGLHLAADRDFSLYKRSKAGSEPIPEPKLTINTDSLSVEQSVQTALDYLGVKS